ncbi:CopL family metal-binding regulatory protein [Wenzhouxiangella sp. 15190]|uniref:CopL family metal-binding regulatory protein n=1 Tax=unclassified Wenzhouxiangella TaxID=2613841 RepID=UPI000E3264AE|nr:hypothetical protein DZK25_04975 [Wenzhouxiangella sp. 15181]RFP68605.1 hypothetical protein DZK26_07980 [Wenzhouxiangella sp. 15190]
MDWSAASLLRYILAIALVAGGLSAWSIHANPIVMDQSTQAVSSAGDQQGSDCHPDNTEPASDSTSEAHGGDCCDEDKQEGDCTDEKCSCVCPALTLVVPIGSAPAAPAVAQAHAAALAAPAPQKVITTLLRPPRA